MQSEQPKKEEIETMRAITLESFDSGPTLQEIPTPQIAPNEVLVRVRASSVNPVDNAIASGMLKDMVEHEFPVVLGRDFAGVVEQAGSDVRDLSIGDEVFGFVSGMGPTVHDGSWAELIAVPESVATRKPEDIDTASAGAAPLAAITALSALDALGVSEGDTRRTEALVASPSSSPPRPARRLSLLHCPRTRNTLKSSASARYSIVTPTSPRSCTSATQRA
jgi:NADPH:quinone reductase-like Zn-dependent oxidoreductase